MAAHPACAQTTLTPADSNVGTSGVAGGGTADNSGTFTGGVGGAASGVGN